MTRRILALVAGVAIFSGTALSAHHSFSATYTGEKVELEGVVKEFVWRNPHSFLRIDVPDKDGPVEPRAPEGGARSRLSQAEVTAGRVRGAEEAWQNVEAKSRPRRPRERGCCR